MNIMMSIRPLFAARIFNADKRFEFRKSLPKLMSHEDVKIYVYATAPLKKVVGWFRPSGVLIKDKYKLWEVVEARAGIAYSDYLDYYKGHDKAMAIAILEKVEFKEWKDLSEFGLTRPPQSWCYVKGLTE